MVSRCNYVRQNVAATKSYDPSSDERSHRVVKNPAFGKTSAPLRQTLRLDFETLAAFAGE
jgi:hypothetical protein